MIVQPDNVNTDTTNTSSRLVQADPGLDTPNVSNEEIRDGADFILKGKAELKDIADKVGTSTDAVVEVIGDAFKGEKPAVTSVGEAATIGAEKAGEAVGSAAGPALRWLGENVMEPYGDAMLKQAEVNRVGSSELARILWKSGAIHTATDAALLLAVFLAPIPPHYKVLAAIASFERLAAGVTLGYPAVASFVVSAAEAAGFEIPGGRKFVERIAKESKDIQKYLPRVVLARAYSTIKEKVSEKEQARELGQELINKQPQILPANQSATAAPLHNQPNTAKVGFGQGFNRGGKVPMLKKNYGGLVRR